MAAITSEQVMSLRTQTGAGIMDCKGALNEASGDLAKAVEILRKKGLAGLAKRAGRAMKEGVVVAKTSPDGKTASFLEISCETDFVAKNELFRAFADQIAKVLAENPAADVESLRTEAVARIRENIKIARFKRFEVVGNGLVAAYIHTGSKVGVLVEVGAGTEASVARDDFKQLVRDITLQIAAANPVAVRQEDVDPAFIAKEREIIANSDLLKNKPPQAIAKIIEGKLDKFYKENCLLNQGFVKRNGEISVQEHIGGVAKQLGDEIVVRRFLRFQVGEAFAA